MHIFLFILLFLGIIIILGLSFIGALLRAIFGIGRRSSPRRAGQPQYEHPGQQSYRSNSDARTSSNDYEEEVLSNNPPKSKHKKLFTKEDGEYVDFEEVKE